MTIKAVAPFLHRSFAVQSLHGLKEYVYPKLLFVIMCVYHCMKVAWITLECNAGSTKYIVCMFSTHFEVRSIVCFDMDHALIWIVLTSNFQSLITLVLLTLTLPFIHSIESIHRYIWYFLSVVVVVVSSIDNKNKEVQQGFL